MALLHVTRRALLTGVALGAVGVDAHAGTPSHAPLFVIARTTNANVVHYDARLTSNGALDRTQPLVAYWVMHADGGRREALTWLERKLAYGWSASFDARGELQVVLTACATRGIRVFRSQNGLFRALVSIRGRPALLERVYVASDDGGLLPSVRYVDLFGVAPGDGGRVTERIVPS